MPREHLPRDLAVSNLAVGLCPDGGARAGVVAVVITPQQLLGSAPQETHHQQAFFQWIALYGSKRHPDMAMAHAVPNGAKLMGVGTSAGQREGARMKAEGLRPGVPDVFVPVPLMDSDGAYRPGRCGLWIEFKKPGREREKDGGRSPDQVKWHKLLLAQGYAVVTAYGWTGGAKAITDYFEGYLEMPQSGDCFFVLEQPDGPW